MIREYDDTSGRGLSARGPLTPIYDSAARPHPFVEELREIFRYRDLVVQWSRRNIQLRYKRSVLGVVWTLLEPLMLMTILALVFSNAFGDLISDFPVYLLSGLILFDFFSRSTLQIVEEIIASQSLAERIHVPRSAFAVAAVVTYLVNWLIAHLPLIGLALVFGRDVNASILTIPAGMLLAALFALGIGLIVATMGAFFLDIRLTYQVLLTGWFYATPIIYSLSIVPESRHWIFRLNPVLHLVELVRKPIYDGVVAPAEHWLIAGGVSISVLVAGWAVFTHWRNAFDYRS
ncbi:MAG: ABC transporter permease [Acidobacteriota bacterium]|nr:ABC transporter permease [Acidobacteriota bacterium]MDH3522133.1 ABC transporter permease [Acidobacteriota bacterium]